MLRVYTGKTTRGYDPSQDIAWLKSEVVQWVRGNLMQKWYEKGWFCSKLTVSGAPSSEDMLQ